MWWWDVISVLVCRRPEKRHAVSSRFRSKLEDRVDNRWRRPEPGRLHLGDQRLHSIDMPALLRLDENSQRSAHQEPELLRCEASCAVIHEDDVRLSPRRQGDRRSFTAIDHGLKRRVHEILYRYVDDLIEHLPRDEDWPVERVEQVELTNPIQVDDRPRVGDDDHSIAATSASSSPGS